MWPMHAVPSLKMILKNMLMLALSINISPCQAIFGKRKKKLYLILQNLTRNAGNVMNIEQRCKDASWGDDVTLRSDS